MGLCGLRALRGLRGFCTRVELGGLEAYGVFASLFVLLPSFFCSCVCLLLCSLAFFALVVFLCPLALSLWLFGVQDLPDVALVLWWCVPRLLSSLLLFPWCVACKYGSISRFKAFLEGFMGFVWVCVACVLCAACVAFVRVWS